VDEGLPVQEDRRASKLANHILQTALERDFEPSCRTILTLDHGFCIPLWKGGLDPLPPIVPIIFNDLEPPYPSVRRCLHWGTMLAEAVRSYPEDIRVAVLATGASLTRSESPRWARSTSRSTGNAFGISKKATSAL